jgi:DNA-binding response OmpR family regulator
VGTLLTERRIVIVDDDSRLLSVAARYLRKAGYDVLAVADAGTGLPAAADRPTDLVIRIDEFIAKPFTLSSLAAAVRGVVGDPDAPA